MGDTKLTSSNKATPINSNSQGIASGSGTMQFGQALPTMPQNFNKPAKMQLGQPIQPFNQATGNSLPRMTFGQPLHQQPQGFGQQDIIGMLLKHYFGG